MPTKNPEKLMDKELRQALEHVREQRQARAEAELMEEARELLMLKRREERRWAESAITHTERRAMRKKKLDALERKARAVDEWVREQLLERPRQVRSLQFAAKEAGHDPTGDRGVPGALERLKAVRVFSHTQQGTHVAIPDQYSSDWTTNSERATAEHAKRREELKALAAETPQQFFGRVLTHGPVHMMTLKAAAQRAGRDPFSDEMRAAWAKMGLVVVTEHMGGAQYVCTPSQLDSLDMKRFNYDPKRLPTNPTRRRASARS